MHEMEEIKPGYFAVIPANVRYSKEISNGAKLLYAEITCLSNDKGYCWASNLYFSKLYEVSTDTVSRWISELARAGFILTIVDNAAGNSRKIWLSETQGIGKKRDTPIRKNADRYPQKSVDPIRKNADIIVKENNKENTTTKAKIDVAVFDSEVNALVVDSIPLEAEKKESPTPIPPPPSPPSEAAPRRYDAFDIEKEADALKFDPLAAERFARETGTPPANMYAALGVMVDTFTSDQKATGYNYNNRIDYRKHFFNLVRRKAEIARNAPKEGGATRQTPPSNFQTSTRH